MPRRVADVRVVAVCDVKSDQGQVARELVDAHYRDQACAAYADFREVLARPDIDAVIVATPDHWHVLIALAAVRAGKDVYLEKPMGLSVAEDQALRAAVRETGRVFQFGTQQRSSVFFRSERQASACSRSITRASGSPSAGVLRRREWAPPPRRSTCDPCRPRQMTADEPSSRRLAPRESPRSRRRPRWSVSCSEEASRVAGRGGG
jgi:hypothetical protein